jgi:hypothetical protein
MFKSLLINNVKELQDLRDIYHNFLTVTIRNGFINRIDLPDFDRLVDEFEKTVGS